MSNPFVYIWDATLHGIPKGYDQAVQQALQLYEQLAEPTMGLISFGDEVETYLENSGEEGWQNTLDGLGRTVRAWKTAALRLELPDEDWQYVLVEMVEVATRHRLVVYYEDAVSVFLPSGKVLPVSRAKAWNGLKESLRQEGGFPQTLGQFKKWITPRFEMMLVKYGDFIKGKDLSLNKYSCYIRTSGQASQFIFISVDGGGGEFGLDICFECSFLPVAAICEKFKFIQPKVVFSSCALSRILKYSTDSDIIVRSFNDAKKLLAVAEEVVFPAMDMANTIQGLDSLLNGDADPRYREYFHNFVFKPQCLLVARLAGNPRFDELVEELGAPVGWHGNARVWRDEWPKLVKYLREEVKPIV